MSDSACSPLGGGESIDRNGMIVCRQCGLARGKQSFRRRYAGQDLRIRQCRGCHAYKERLRRQARRSKRAADQLARLGRAQSARQVITVCERLIQAFGGLRGFASAWDDCLRRDLSRGGVAALRHLEAVVRLVQHCDAERLNYSKNTDLELQGLAETLSGP